MISGSDVRATMNSSMRNRFDSSSIGVSGKVGVAILKVARLGHPVLRRVAEPVPRGEIARPETQRLIDDMIETMHEYIGVGLAAPQVHVSRQIAVLECDVAPAPPRHGAHPADGDHQPGAHAGLRRDGRRTGRAASPSRTSAGSRRGTRRCGWRRTAGRASGSSWSPRTSSRGCSSTRRTT